MAIQTGYEHRMTVRSGQFGWYITRLRESLDLELSHAASILKLEIDLLEELELGFRRSLSVEQAEAICTLYKVTSSELESNGARIEQVQASVFAPAWPSR